MNNDNSDETKSCNNYGTLGVKELSTGEEQVLAVIQRYKEGVNPKTIAHTSGLNYNSVRGIVRRLVQKFKIRKMPTGMYVANLAIDGIPKELRQIKFQNAVLKIKLPSNKSYKRENHTQVVGGVKLRFQIGAESKEANIHISGEPPFDLDLLTELSEIFRKKVIQHTGYDAGDNVLLVSIELNHDIPNMRLEGVQSITFQSFSKELLKYYNKKGALRSELKLSLNFPIPVNQLIGWFVEYGPILHKVNHEQYQQSERIAALETKLEKQHNFNKAFTSAIKSIRQTAPNKPVKVQVINEFRTADQLQ